MRKNSPLSDLRPGKRAKPEPPPAPSAVLRFAVAGGLTVAYVAFAVWASAPWRSDLREAISPVMAWVIPIRLAYVPAVLIGFMTFTLITLRYRVPSPEPPKGPWPQGEWPPVTIVVAARDEESVIEATLERIATLAYEGHLEIILADNNSTDRTAEIAEETARRCVLDFRRIFEPQPGKWRALNTALEEVQTPVVVTVDADLDAEGRSQARSLPPRAGRSGAGRAERGACPCHARRHLAAARGDGETRAERRGLPLRRAG